MRVGPMRVRYVYRFYRDRRAVLLRPLGVFAPCILLAHWVKIPLGYALQLICRLGFGSLYPLTRWVTSPSNFIHDEWLL